MSGSRASQRLGSYCLADVSAVAAFAVAWAFALPVASAVAGHMLATSASERAIESIADAGCFRSWPLLWPAAVSRRMGQCCRAIFAGDILR